MTTGNTQFKVENGLYVTGNANLENNVWIGGSANIVGDFTVGGSVVFTANVTGNFIPDISGRALGSSAKRWEMWANSLNVSNTATFNGVTQPTANGLSLGTASGRWYVYTTDIDTSNSVSVSNNVSISNTLSVSNRINVGSVGSIQSNTLVYANAVVGQTTIDSFSATAYRTTKYLIEVKNTSTGFQSSEMLVTHDGTTVFITEYGIVNSVATFCTFDADISGGNVRLLATPTTNATFKIARTNLSA